MDSECFSFSEGFPSKRIIYWLARRFKSRSRNCMACSKHILAFYCKGEFSFKPVTILWSMELVIDGGSQNDPFSPWTNFSEVMIFCVDMKFYIFDFYSGRFSDFCEILQVILPGTAATLSMRFYSPSVSRSLYFKVIAQRFAISVLPSILGLLRFVTGLMASHRF